MTPTVHSVGHVPRISVIVTSYNEGTELRRTLDSVRENTAQLEEIIVVDDGSGDGSSDRLEADGIHLIRHSSRMGIARSRNEGSRIARGNVLCYLDAHQRIGAGALDQCAKLALLENSITCPDVRDYGLLRWRLHGAEFRLCPERGYFTSTWRQWFQRRGVRQVSGLRAPPYLIPRCVYDDVAWSNCLQGWGASEASVALKAFFTGCRILHISGPIVRHQFQVTSGFSVSWEELYQNQAVIARICFSEEVWCRYWLPHVFDGHLSESARRLLAGEQLMAEHEEFQKRKIRSDQAFWTELLRMSPPSEI
jgi:glycosyltransferase involved in cell wall biosynthesis